MPASTNKLTLYVNEQDSSSVNILSRVIGALSYGGTVGQYTDGILTTTGATAITLPTTNVYQLIFYNTHATAFITVNWTPTSATGSVIAAKVGPSGVLALWQTATGSSGAITALTGTADTANATYELFLGG